MPVADCVDRIFAVSQVRYESSPGPTRPNSTRCQKKMPLTDSMYPASAVPGPGVQLTMSMNTAAATTTTRTTIEAMCILTIDCKCDTWSEGITRYQCPRIMAVHAPPRSAAELKKLATVIACADKPEALLTPCATSAIRPAPTAVATMAGRTEASARPTVAQYSNIAASTTTSASTARRP